MESDRERLFELVPEAREFEWIDNLTAIGWLYHTGSLGNAIAYAELFWPLFIEHDGCILLSRRFDPDNYREWMTYTRGDRRAVEGVINHTHILDLFMNREPKPTREQVVHLGRVLRETWQAKVDRDFPGRGVEVIFYEAVGEDLLGYEVTVVQRRT